MSGLIKKVVIGLLSSIVSTSNHTKCVSLSNQKCRIQPALINLHPNECSQKLHYYSFVVNVDKCVGSCNTLNNLSNKVSFPNKTEDLNISKKYSNKWIKNYNKTYHVNVNVNMMEENVMQIKSEIMINTNMSVKNITCMKKIILRIELHVVVKMVNI